MVREKDSTATRRKFLRTSAMAGATATGIVGVSGAAAAQPENLDGHITGASGTDLPGDEFQLSSVELLLEDLAELADQLTVDDFEIVVGGGLVTIGSIDVTVIEGDVNVDVNIEDVAVTVVAQVCAIVIGEQVDCEQLAELVGQQ